MLPQPPAVSDLPLAAALSRWLRGDPRRLDEVIRDRLGSIAVVTATSWVALLQRLLEELARVRPERREVVIPSFSCNEFNLAALAADLEVVTIDLDERMRTDPERVAAACGPRTLAALAVNNLGCESDNAAIQEVCERAGVVCIEDATYTFLGRSDRDGRAFGTYGELAILNFSEGKILPIGGGAVCLNRAGWRPSLAALERRVGAAAPCGNLTELADLAMYRLGSSSLGFALAWGLRRLSGIDLKRRLTREPTRVDDLAGAIRRDPDGRLVLDRAERDRLLGLELRPHNRVKQLCGAAILAGIETERRRRAATLTEARRQLLPLGVAEEMPLPRQGVYIKAPWLCRRAPAAERAARLARLGMLSGYRVTHPTYGDPAFPNSNRFYERVVTVPLHRRIDRRILARIARELAAR